MKKTLACCYLTHNHPEIMKNILERAADDYRVYGIDICIYDDSDNEDTHLIVDAFRENGFDNLYYVDAHVVKDSNDKMLYILKGYGLPKDYDYIWPSKDRVFFSREFLKRLRNAVDEDHDVIQIASEYQRWDISRPMVKEIIRDPREFYRDYNVYTVNWEGTIRKRKTMLEPIDWGEYYAAYDLEHELFGQPVTLFGRLAQMSSSSVRICRFNAHERFIYPSQESGWKNNLFEVWIDRFVRSNYNLPSVYDPYKIEAIRSQTSIMELFGSVESMIEFQKKGLYDLNVFRKYEGIWPLVSIIQVEWLRLIAEGKIEETLLRAIDDFEMALFEHDYLRAQRLIGMNTWFNLVYDKETYGILAACFSQYRKDMLERGISNVFSGLGSVDAIKERYKRD